MDTDAQEATEETIFTGEDLMTGPPSPLVPPELAPQILDGIELCASHLRKLFECLHTNDIEPFCQDEILIYKRCSQNRDSTVRSKMYKAEETLGRVLPDDLREERVAKLKSDVDVLERRFILASGVEGVEGFRQRWGLNGQLVDTKNRMQSLEKGVASKQQGAAAEAPSRKAWWQVNRLVGMADSRIATENSTLDMQRVQMIGKKDRVTTYEAMMENPKTYFFALTFNKNGLLKSCEFR